MARKSSAKKGSSKQSTSKKGAAKGDRSNGSSAAPGSRPVWSGTMRLALVSVPVKLYAATRSGGRVSLHQVHEPSGKRVRYQKVVPGIGPIDTDEIVKGAEVEKDRYVLIDPEEIEELKVEAKKTLDLVQFVTQGEIDPIWFERPYYMVPDGELAEEAYRVLRDALRSTNRLGIGQFVMRGREYIAAVKPCGNGLLLETIRFADEVHTAAPFFSNVEDEEPDEELLELATDLIERKSAPFEPERFEDQYTNALRELINAKAKRREPVEIGEEKRPSGGGQVIDLVDALKRSVKNADRPSPQSSRSRKKSGNGRKKKAS